MIKTSNRKASTYVANLKEFTGSNTFGVWENPDCYVVYSYGKHFPMYLYNKTLQEWFINEDKYSVSTSKQTTQLHPNVSCTVSTTTEIKKMIKDAKK